MWHHVELIVRHQYLLAKIINNCKQLYLHFEIHDR
jgi:hypothetical protein